MIAVSHIMLKVGIAQGFGYGSRFSIRKSLSMLMFGYPFLVKAFNSVKEREL